MGIATVRFAWLVFALRYADWDRVFTRRNLVLLAAVPLATLLLVATNEAHGLISGAARGSALLADFSS